MPRDHQLSLAAHPALRALDFEPRLFCARPPLSEAEKYRRAAAWFNGWRAEWRGMRELDGCGQAQRAKVTGDEEAAFNRWVERECPQGDCSYVNEQWLKSEARAEFIDSTTDKLQAFKVGDRVRVINYLPSGSSPFGNGDEGEVVGVLGSGVQCVMDKFARTRFVTTWRTADNFQTCIEVISVAERRIG